MSTERNIAIGALLAVGAGIVGYALIRSGAYTPPSSPPPPPNVASITVSQDSPVISVGGQVNYLGEALDSSGNPDGSGTLYYWIDGIEQGAVEVVSGAFSFSLTWIVPGTYSFLISTSSTSLNPPAVVSNLLSLTVT